VDASAPAETRAPPPPLTKQTPAPFQFEGRIKPDRLMVIASDIEAHVTFGYSLWQSALMANIPLGSGAGELVLKGFLGLDVDLHNIGDAAITDCRGYFGAAPPPRYRFVSVCLSIHLSIYLDLAIYLNRRRLA